LSFFILILGWVAYGPGPRPRCPDQRAGDSPGWMRLPSRPRPAGRSGRPPWWASH